MAAAADETRDGIVHLGIEPGVVGFYGFENITVIVWRARPTLGAAQHLARVSERRRKEFAHGISALHLVQATFEMPDGPTRDAFVRLLKNGEGKLAVLCVVAGAAGFWASALRSLVTGLRVLSRGSFDLGLHANIHEAVDYLVPRHFAKTGVAVEPERLKRVLTTLDHAK